jgi:hypothetical protein
VQQNRETLEGGSVNQAGLMTSVVPLLVTSQPAVVV